MEKSDEDFGGGTGGLAITAEGLAAFLPNTLEPIWRAKRPLPPKGVGCFAPVGVP